MRKLTTYNLQLTTSKHGFTLIELLIAMAVFVLLLGIVANIFITSLQRQRSVVALMVANDNASIAMEQMTREIRTGSNFSVDPVTGALQFKNAKGEAIEYRYNPDPVFAIERSVNGVSLPLTSKNVKINAVRFSVITPGPSWPPRIVMNIQVAFTDRFLQTVVNDLQTTVSAREI